MNAPIIFVSLIAIALASRLYIANNSLPQGMKHGSSEEERSNPVKSDHEGACPMIAGISTVGFYLDNKTQLNLSREQVEILTSLQADLKRSFRDHSAILHKANQEVEALAARPEATRAELREKLEVTEQHFAALSLANLQAWRNARSILTPEQNGIAQALRRQMLLPKDVIQGDLFDA